MTEESTGALAAEILLRHDAGVTSPPPPRPQRRPRPVVPDEPEEPPSRRQESRRARKDAGADSAELANTLMKLPDSSIGKLGLDEELHLDVVRARAITAPIARRRAERNLAGILRRVDLRGLATTIENVRTTGLADPSRLHATERWRARLIDETEGPAAAEAALAAFRAEFSRANHKPLPRLIEDAKKERRDGKPPGAGRALFRHISAVLEAAADADEEADEEATDDDDASGEDEATGEDKAAGEDSSR